ncbi:MAG: diguanylate cyclase domain-containing protein [Candidatus Limnocylindrales bacterium]
MPTANVASASPLSPDDATQREQVRQFLTVLLVVATAAGALQGIAAFFVGSPRWWATALLFGAFAVWVGAYPRRVVDRAEISTIVNRVALAIFAVAAGAALLLPFNAITATTALLIPSVFALPYLEGRRLRRLMVITWLTSLVTVAAGFLSDDTPVPVAAINFQRAWGLALVFGLIVFMFYRTSERLKASSREFRRLFQLSSDLAEATDPGVLSELVARHLAEATGFEDCVIYALTPETDRLAPFASHPIDRSLEATPESAEARPALGRVFHDQTRIIIDVADERADPIEVGRLQARGRAVMLLLPLVALSHPVGVAELTASERRPPDERRLALARTLAFEAAIAIENGRLRREMHHRALHDPLTSLGNRNLFRDRVEHALARLLRREGVISALLFVDLDDFKAVNDTLGHAQGDRLLVLVAERLRAAVRPGDTVARFGGDEFALLLEDLASDDEALLVAERIVAAIASPFDLAGRPVMASVSIGVAVHSAGVATAVDFLQQADAAMYAAKRAGKGRAVRFDPGLTGVVLKGDATAVVSAHSFGSAGPTREAPPADAPRG